MASTSETGHAKIETNFFTLITFCTGYGPTYNPSNPDIAITALTDSHTAAKATIQVVKVKKVPFDNAEGARMLIYKPLKPLSTKIIGALKAVNASKTVIKDAETINRKIQGKRAPGTPPASLPANGVPTPDPVSVSQQSYDMQLDHFKSLVELVAAEPKYIPNETPLQVVALNGYINEMENINQTVRIAYTPYSNAMIDRNTALYGSERGLVDLAQTVKNYVKSTFNASSPQFKQISGLRFRRPKQ